MLTTKGKFCCAITKQVQQRKGINTQGGEIGAESSARGCIEGREVGTSQVILP
jgi:hypothetical protein